MARNNHDWNDDETCQTNYTVNLSQAAAVVAAAATAATAADGSGREGIDAQQKGWKRMTSEDRADFEAVPVSPERHLPPSRTLSWHTC